VEIFWVLVLGSSFAIWFLVLVSREVDRISSWLKKPQVTPEQKRRSIPVSYVAGLPGVGPGVVRVYPAPGGTLLVNTVALAVTSCDWVQQSRRSPLGAVAGGVIGDAVFGTPGAVVGALVGGRSKNASLTALTGTVRGVQTVAYFRTTSSEHSRILSLLSK
jgi:hypothetical protein